MKTFHFAMKTLLATVLLSSLCAAQRSPNPVRSTTNVDLGYSCNLGSITLTTAPPVVDNDFDVEVNITGFPHTDAVVALVVSTSWAFPGTQMLPTALGPCSVIPNLSVSPITLPLTFTTLSGGNGKANFYFDRSQIPVQLAGQLIFIQPYVESFSGLGYTGNAYFFAFRLIS